MTAAQYHSVSSRMRSQPIWSPAEMERLSEPTSIEPEPFATHIWKQKDNIHGMIASIRYDMFLQSTGKCRMIRIRGNRCGAMSRA